MVAFSLLLIHLLKIKVSEVCMKKILKELFDSLDNIHEFFVCCRTVSFPDSEDDDFL